jgi:hypothetical protein
VVNHGAGGEVAAVRTRQQLRFLHGGLGLGDPASVQPGLGQLAEDSQLRVSGQIGAGKKFFVTGYPGYMVAASDEGPGQVEHKLGWRRRPGQVHGRLQVAPGRTHGAGLQRFPPCLGQDV